MIYVLFIDKLDHFPLISLSDIVMLRSHVHLIILMHI